MAQKIRIAVVGVGYLGRFHAQKCKALAEKIPSLVEFTGVCDTYEPQAQKVSEELGVPYFKTVDELLSQVDAISLATTTLTHHELSVKILEISHKNNQKVHLNVEKPLSENASKASQLLELAKRNGVVLTVGHSERFSLVHKKVKELCADLKPVHFEFYRQAPFKKRGADVSVVHDLMIHDLDLFLDLHQSSFGSMRVEIESAQGQKVLLPTLDIASVYLKSPHMQATISSSRVSPIMQRTVKVIGEKGSVMGDYQTGDVHVWDSSKEGTPAEKLSLGRNDTLSEETLSFLLQVGQRFVEHKIWKSEDYQMLSQALNEGRQEIVKVDAGMTCEALSICDNIVSRIK